MSTFLRKTLFIVSCFFLSLAAKGQTPGLLISGFMANPQGSDANKEFAELTATTSIDFTVTPYSVLFVQGENATASGWAGGTTSTYGFLINTGTVAKGDKIYIGGTLYAASYLSGTCNTYTRNTSSGGSTFGTGSSNGVLGNGGGQYDAVGVFNMNTSAITSTTVPVDAIFYGDGTGPGTAANKFTLPTNDRYSNAQGKFGVGTNTFIAPDPGGDQFIRATGVLDDVSNIWSTPRTWAVNATTPIACGASSSITFSVANNLSLTVNTSTTTTLLSAPDISGVISDPTDPAATQGIVFDVKDNGSGIAAVNYTLTAGSSNTAVVPNANILVTKGDGAATVKITPAGIGYTTITLTLTKSSLTKTYVINYASSSAASTPAQTVFHSGLSDGSAEIALDNTYMVVADDEKNVLNVYNRNASGLPVKTFDYSGIAGLNLGDLSGGIPREIDVEATAKSAVNVNRSYWLGSLSNQSTGSFNNRPNRNRLFALDITGTGAATAFNYVGDYENLKSALINWGTTYGLGLSASATVNTDPKLITGFNIEGMAFAPDNTTMYIGFRAPLEPVSNRINALIAPIQNFETWFGNGTTNTPTFGTPILLDLGGRGIRDIARLNSGVYIILAGDYDDAGAIATVVYRWNGNPTDAPVLLSGFNVAGLNPEGILPLFTGGVMNPDQLQLVSDNGNVDFYNDGTAAKDLTTNNFKKFRSDFITSLGSPLPVVFNDFKADYLFDGNVSLKWHCGVSANIDRFELERSTDGSAFEHVTTVAADPEMGDYSYVDHVCCAPAFFYRIKEVNLDGSYYYSAVKMVNMPTDAMPVLIGYNPDNKMVSIISKSNELKTVNIWNASGHLVLTKNVKEENAGISLKEMPENLYIVEVRMNNEVKRMKIAR